MAGPLAAEIVDRYCVSEAPQERQPIMDRLRCSGARVLQYLTRMSYRSSRLWTAFLS